MSSKWLSSTWGEEISLEYGKSLRDYNNERGKYRVFGSNGPIGWTDKPLTSGPGVILGRKGAYRGVQFCQQPFFVIDTAYFVVPKKESDIRWLYYAIKHYKLGEMDDGSPIPSTTRAAVYVRDIAVPPLPEQKAIAAILGSLDDKIELNRRMNATLEAMARALFQSWFVDFDPVRAKMDGRVPVGMDAETAALFPDSFEDSALGKIPKGWEIKSLADLTSLITKGTTPTQQDLLGARDGDAKINYVRVNSLDDDAFVLKDKLTVISESVHIGVLKRSILEVNDILYTIAGTIGRISLVEDWLVPANTNQAVAIVRSREEIPPNFLFLAMRHENVREELQNNVVHAVQANLSLGMLSKVRLVVPTIRDLPKLFLAIDLHCTQISANRSQSRNLKTLRDALLPKLLSGEIQLKK